MELYMNKGGFGLMDPVALIGNNVAIHYQQTTTYRKVLYFEPIAPFQALNIGALTAQTQSTKASATNLQMWDNEFGQFRWYTIDNAQVRLYLPGGIAKAMLRNQHIPFDKNIIKRDPTLALTEFFVWEDNGPSFEAYNGMDYDLSAVRIIAGGFRYFTEEIEDPEKVRRLQTGNMPCQPIWCSGWAGGRMH